MPRLAPPAGAAWRAPMHWRLSLQARAAAAPVSHKPRSQRAAAPTQRRLARGPSRAPRPTTGVPGISNAWRPPKSAPILSAPAAPIRPPQSARSRRAAQRAEQRRLSAAWRAAPRRTRQRACASWRSRRAARRRRSRWRGCRPCAAGRRACERVAAPRQLLPRPHDKRLSSCGLRLAACGEALALRAFGRIAVLALLFHQPGQRVAAPRQLPAAPARQTAGMWRVGAMAYAMVGCLRSLRWQFSRTHCSFPAGSA